MTISEFINKVGFKVNEGDVAKVNNTISSIKSTATKFLGAIGIGFSLTAINGLVEEFDAVNDGIRNSIGGLEDVNAVQHEILEAANAAKSSYSDMAGVVSNLAKSNEELFPVQDAIDFSTNVTKLMKSFGRGDGQIASIMEGLNKSFQKGIVDSETLNKMLEEAPETANILAEHLGVAKSELIQMATDGRMSVMDLKNAFLESTEEIDAAFGQLNFGISDALLNIRNKWGFWLKETDETLGITQSIGKTMVAAFDKIIGALSKARNGVVWLTDKLGGAEKLFRLIGIVAGAAFGTIGFFKLLAFIDGMKKLDRVLLAARTKMLAIIAVVVLIALLVEDFFNFMKGNDSVIGSLLEKAGIDVEKVRQTIIGAWDKIKSFLLTAWNIIKAVCFSIWGGIKDFFAKHGDQIKAKLAAVWDAIKAALVLAWNFIKDKATEIFGNLQSYWAEHGDRIKSQLADAWNAIKTALLDAWNIIKEQAIAIFDILRSFWSKHGEQIKTSFVNIWNGIKIWLSNVWKLIQTIAIVVFGALKKFWDTWGGTIIAIFAGIWNVIKALFSAALDIIADIFAIFSDLFSGNWSQLWIDLKALASDVLNGIFNVISRILAAIWGVILSVFSVIWEYISGIATSIWEAITTAFTNIWTGITETVGNIKDSIVDGFTDAIDWIKSLPAQALQWGADIIQGIVDGIKGAIGKVGDAVSGVASKIKSFIGFSEPEDGPLSDFHTYMPDMIDLMTTGIQNGREKVKKALGNIAGDMSVMASANVVSSGTAAVAAGSNQVSKSVVQNVEINNKFQGDSAIQKDAAGAMDKSAKDTTAELARALAYAK